MAKVYDRIDDNLADWMRRQHLFFVATAPLAADGHVNCSPKGLDTFAILGPNTIAYLDLTGSGAETIAHLRENGRIVLMFCALTGAPKIVRLHGVGVAIEPHMPEFAELSRAFPMLPGVRSIVKVEVNRVSDSCGFGVPLFDYVGERDALIRWCETKGPEGTAAYQQRHNLHSLDGLPSVTPAPR